MMLLTTVQYIYIRYVSVVDLVYTSFKPTILLSHFLRFQQACDGSMW